jgi:hypothetical protein
METHIPKLNDTRIDWRKLCLEFVFIFVAVLLASIAEWYLEHRYEKKREKMYMKNLLIDLSDDAASFQQESSRWLKCALYADSVMYYLKKPAPNSFSDKIYIYSKSFFWMAENPFFKNDRTFEQLIYSGNFRLIDDQALSYEINSYYGSNEIRKGHLTNIHEYQRQCISEANKVLDFQYLKEQIDNVYKNDSARYFAEFDETVSLAAQYKLLNTDKVVLNGYYSFLFKTYDVIMSYKGFVLDMKKSAEELIVKIKERYSL